MLETSTGRILCCSKVEDKKCEQCCERYRCDTTYARPDLSQYTTDQLMYRLDIAQQAKRLWKLPDTAHVVAVDASTTQVFIVCSLREALELFPIDLLGCSGCDKTGLLAQNLISVCDVIVKAPYDVRTQCDLVGLWVNYRTVIP